MASLSTLALTLVAFVNIVSPQVIVNDYEFFGESPPVYPTPRGAGTGNWAAAYQKASAFVAQLTVEEKVNLTAGGTPLNGCSGVIQSIPRLGFPGLCLSDAGNGVRSTDFVNSYPSGLHAGASWNKGLTHQRAVAMGGEFRTKGVNVALGPVVGPLGRVAYGGRNWEGFSNDPYLCGALAYETVAGMQSTGVITSLKHYIGNEQETNRNPSVNAQNETVHSVSSNIDDKTIHELYLWPFQDGLRSGTANVMCSYNRLNNSYGCQNSKSLNGLLKTELGFQGFVVSDWFAQHGGVASANAGLDMAMPNAQTFWGANLTEAATNGSVAMTRLNDMATRIIAAWYHLGQDSGFPEPGVGMPFLVSEPHVAVNARKKSSKSVLMEGAIEGHVLVKNVNNALPLKNLQLLSIFGYDAKVPDIMNPTGPTFAEEFGPLSWILGWESIVNIGAYLAGFLGTVATEPPSQIAQNGTLFCGGGSGGNAPAYISAPYDALQERAYQDDFSLFWDFDSQDPIVAGASDGCLVFINAFSSEGADRIGLADEYSDTLVTNVAANCSNTMVIIHNAGIRLVDTWIDHPNITAVIFAHLPGQDSGKALVQILFGDTGPSGKLPYTVAKKESDYGALLAPAEPSGIYEIYPQSNFTEGVYIDYRAFDAMNIEPRYEFGFGLTYTTFSYSDLVIKPIADAVVSMYPPKNPILQGGNPALFDVLYHVSASITNVGSYGGAEIAQLYIGIPGGPIRQLRGFDKISVPVGKTGMAQFDLTRRDLSTWDTVAQQWLLQTGSYCVYVGASSRILPLEGTITITY